MTERVALGCFDVLMSPFEVTLLLIATVGSVAAAAGAWVQERRSSAAQLAAVQRKLDLVMQHLGIAAPDLQAANRLTRVNRRPHRSGIDHLGDDLVAHPARHHQPNNALGRGRNPALRATENFRVGDDLAVGKQDAGFEVLEAVFQQPLGVVGAILRVLASGEHDDQPHAILHGRADQIVAGLGGVAWPVVPDRSSSSASRPNFSRSIRKSRA